MEFSLTEMGVILFVALLLYGGRLPKVALAVGRAVGEFKKGLRETSDMVRYEMEEADRAVDLPGVSHRLDHDVNAGLQDDPAYATEDISLPADAPSSEAEIEPDEPGFEPDVEPDAPAPSPPVN